MSYQTSDNAASRRGLAALAGTVPPPDLDRRILVQNARVAPHLATLVEDVPLPDYFDWRNTWKVLRVGNQLQCGCCWCFASCAAFESAHVIKNRCHRRLSTQFVLDAIGPAVNEAYSCNGGWWAFDLFEKIGVPRAIEFPYKGQADPSWPDPKQFTKLYKAERWGYVHDQAGIPEADAIKRAIIQHGPVVAAVMADANFTAYSGGVFNEQNNNQAQPVNHAIVLTGWDDANNTWALKNSWGEEWGVDGGFMWIERGSNNVGYGAAWVDAAADDMHDPGDDPDVDPAFRAA